MEVSDTASFMEFDSISIAYSSDEEEEQNTDDQPLDLRVNRPVCSVQPTVRPLPSRVSESSSDDDVYIQELDLELAELEEIPGLNLI